MADDFTMYLTACEMVILNELSHKEVTQKQIAQTYRLSIEAENGNGEVINWKKVNEAIVARWGTKSLDRIKNLAWSGKCFITPKPKA